LPEVCTTSVSSTLPSKLTVTIMVSSPYSFFAGQLGEVDGAFFFDLAAQLVVVDGVDLFARGRADVALLRPRVFFVDAALDLGQQLDQVRAFPRARPGPGCWRAAWGRAAAWRPAVS
jgi:hypothetical protein